MTSHRRRAARLLIAIGVAVLTASPLDVPDATASGSGCESWTGSQPPGLGGQASQLTGVAVLSPCDAWAVGYGSAGALNQTLIEHWNGGGWTAVPSPNPGANGSVLVGVSASSASRAWAVGSIVTASGRERTLVVRWNGHAWKRVPSPSPGSDVLSGVSAVSGSSAWAVGDSISGDGTDRTLVLRWNGRAWTRVASPSPESISTLISVTATSADNAWAVGGRSSGKGSPSRTLILHWNGRRWSRVPSPSPLAPDSILLGVAPVTGSDAWAVGGSTFVLQSHTLVLHWNGHAWARVASPTPGIAGSLDGVVASSASDAWAVGGFATAGSGSALLLHWNGRRWTSLPAALPPGSLGSDGLLGVGAASPRDVWAVGSAADAGNVNQPFASHCC